MVLRIIQHLLLCATFGAVVLNYEIELEPSSAVVQEFDSINLTCSHGKQLNVMLFEIISHNVFKWTSIVFLASCMGEGPIVDNVESYDFYCTDNKSLTVTIKSVLRSRNMDKFTCKSISTTNRSISSNEATIYVTIPVDHIVLKNESNTPVATMKGLKTVFVCITKNVYPEPEFIWFANSMVLQNTTHNVSITQEATTKSYPRSFQSIVTLFPKRSDNFTAIYCKANNTNGWRISGAVHMLVYFPPDTPSLTKNGFPITGHISAIVGNPLTFVCSCQSYPKPHYQWAIENTVVAVGNILDISNVSHPYHTATFTCKVNNTMPLYNGNRYGSNETSITVEVLCTPRTDLNADVQFNATCAIDQTVTLSYTALAYPHPSFVWYRNGSSINTRDSRITISSTDMQTELTIINVEESDYGEYPLTISNEVGSINESFHLKPDEHKQSIPDASKQVWVIVGGTLSGIVVLVGIVCSVFIYRKRIVTSSTKHKEPACSPVTYENLEIDQIPKEPLEYERDTASNHTTETNVNNTYEGLYRDDNGKENEYMCIRD